MTVVICRIENDVSIHIRETILMQQFYPLSPAIHKLDTRWSTSYTLGATTDDTEENTEISLHCLGINHQSSIIKWALHDVRSAKPKPTE